MNLKPKHGGIALVIAVLMLNTACSRANPEAESFGTGASSKWRDPNYDIITAGSYNYTDYDIFNVTLLPPSSNSLDDAAYADGASATLPTDTDWSGGSGHQPSIAWDMRWKTPKTFKVWWQRIVDPQASKASEGYDRYTHREANPGTAWCEGEITVTRPPIKDKFGGLMLHFFPDGRVEGDIDQSVEGPAPKVPFSQRGQLPKLTGRACLKEIPNPYYGRKKPPQWN